MLLFWLVVVNLALALLALWSLPWMGRRVEKPSAPSSTDLVSLLSEARSPYRKIAIGSAARMGKEPVRCTPCLVAMIEVVRTSGSEVALAATWVVRQILAESPALMPLCWPDASPVVRRAVIGLPESTRSASTSSRQVALDEASARVIEAAATDPDSRVRHLALVRVQVLGHRGELDLASAAIDDSDPEVRRVGCEILGLHGDATTATRLVERLACSAPDRAPMLLRALAQLGLRHPGSLIQLASSEDTEVRAAAIRAIGATGMPSMFLNIAPLLTDEARDVRRAAGNAIAEIAMVSPPATVPPWVVDSLTAQLDREQSTSVLMAIINALDACSARDAVGALLQKLSAMNPSVAARALEVIAELERSSGRATDGSRSQATGG